MLCGDVTRIGAPLTIVPSASCTRILMENVCNYLKLHVRYIIRLKITYSPRVSDAAVIVNASRTKL